MACMVMTPRATYSGHNGIEQIFTCDELTIQIVENPIINRARLKKAGLEHGTALDVAKAASDRLSGPQGGYFGKFTTKRIQESEVGGLLVVTATFGCTVYDRLSAVPSGDISGHWVEVPFVRISDLSGWLEDWLSGNISVDVDLTDYREKTDLSTYTKTVLSWNTNPETVYGSELTWRPESEWWCNNADVSAEWDAGTVIVKWDGEKWIGLGNAIEEWVDMGSTDPHATELTLDLRTVGGQQVFELTRSGYDDIYTPDGDMLARWSQISAMYSPQQIDVLIDQVRANMDLSVYSGRVLSPWNFTAGQFVPLAGEEDAYQWGVWKLSWDGEHWQMENTRYPAVPKTQIEGTYYDLELNVPTIVIYLERFNADTLRRTGVWSWVATGDIIATENYV